MYGIIIYVSKQVRGGLGGLGEAILGIAYINIYSVFEFYFYIVNSTFLVHLVHPWYFLLSINTYILEREKGKGKP